MNAVFCVYQDYVQKMLEIQRSLIGQFEVIKPGRVSPNRIESTDLYSCIFMCSRVRLNLLIEISQKNQTEVLAP